MTSSIPPQQYNPQALAGGFAPIEQVDISQALAAEQARQMAPERARLQELAANDRVRVQNSRQYGKDLETLGQFSETLSNALVEHQKKENEKAQQRGIMKAYTDGVSLEDKVAFEVNEQNLESVNVAAGKDAAEYETQTGDTLGARTISKLSGWEKYGYAKGKMQIASQGFPMFIAQNADAIKVLVDGKQVTLSSADTSEEAAAVLSKMVSMYLEPYKGFNPAMVDKYMLNSMRGSMQQQMVLFAQRRSAEIKQEDLLERKNNLLINIDTPGYVSEFVLNHPKGPGAGRLELSTIIDKGLRDGSVSPDQAEIIINSPITFNGDKQPSSLRAKFPGVFGGVPQLIEDTRLSNIRRDDAIEKAEEKEFIDGLIDIAADDSQVTLEEKSAAIQSYRNKFPGRPIPSELSGLYTVDDATKEEQAAFLTMIAEQNGGVIPPMYTIGVDGSVLSQFKDQLSAGVTAESGLKQFKEARKQFITGLLNENQLLDTGGNFKNSQAAIISYNIGKEFDRVFTEYSKNYPPEEAFNLTQEKLRTDVTANYNKFKDIGSADQQAKANRDQAQEALKNNFDITNGILPGVQQTDLESAYKFLKNGRGDIPYIFRYLANVTNLSPIEFAAKQLEAAGYKDFEIPQIELDVTNSQDPQVRKLLRYRNTGARTYRSHVQDPELVRVLDIIGGVESSAHGHYDAYNLGGSQGGEVAHGSGNSAEDGRFGVPISQLKISDILRYHRTGQVHAVGRYQFTAAAFRETVEGLGLPKDTIFDERVQDAMALYRLRWRLNLNNSTVGLMNEWVGLKKLKRAEIEQLLQDAQDVNDPYNRPELLLKGLNGRN